jgi:hypothetical protein
LNHKKAHKGTLHSRSGSMLGPLHPQIGSPDHWT